jgi:hypothetical protein
VFLWLLAMNSLAFGFVQALMGMATRIAVSPSPVGTTEILVIRLELIWGLLHCRVHDDDGVIDEIGKWLRGKAERLGFRKYQEC